MEPETSNKKHWQPSKVFVSYRRKGGAELARLVSDSLQRRRYNVFMDVENLRSGPFNTALFREIQSATDIVVILTPGSMERCRNEGDWVRLEIAYAIEQEKNIVPVMARGFDWASSTSLLPEDLAALPTFNGVESSHEYFEASMDKLATLLIGQPRRSRAWLYWVGGVLAALAVALPALSTFMQEGRSGSGEVGTMMSPLVGDSEESRRERHQALLARAELAESKHEWQEAVNAYEAAIALVDEPKTRTALARAANARDVELVAERKRADFSRLLSEAEQAENSGDLPTAQTTYERAAASAPTDKDRAQAMEKARRVSNNLALQKKVEDANRQKNLMGAARIRVKTLADMPDDVLSVQMRAFKSQPVARPNYQDQSKPQGAQTLMLSYTREMNAESRHPSSDQILDGAGKVIGEVFVEEATDTNSNPEQYVARLFFRRTKGKNEHLCDFRRDDPVGKTRVATAEGISFSAQVTEKAKIVVFGHFASISLQITVKP
ncbi:MAG: toll/interleukin-1 receptor domain-containing protein [Verrucomicrobia bacterium]|nr:toll/interleukin-1 receptor domain-containing protein [Verrucomicrobiota bacterium]